MCLCVLFIFHQSTTHYFHFQTWKSLNSRFSQTLQAHVQRMVMADGRNVQYSLHHFPFTDCVFHLYYYYYNFKEMRSNASVYGKQNDVYYTQTQ